MPRAIVHRPNANNPAVTRGKPLQHAHPLDAAAEREGFAERKLDDMTPNRKHERPVRARDTYWGCFTSRRP